jgi:hypothetical protein
MNVAIRGRVAVVALSAVGLLAGGLPATPAAHASSIKFAYDVNGSSYIPSINSTVHLGPAVLLVSVDGDTGHFAGSLPLPSARTRFQALGLIPIQGTVSFVPSGQVTGRIYNSPSNPRIQKVTSTSRYYLRLSNVTSLGVPLSVGDTCRTVDPVVIKAATPRNGRFNLTTGGPIVGTYSIGEFADCGLSTALINSMVPGGGNTVTLSLTNGRYVP